MSFWQHFYNPIKLQKIAFNTYNYIFILLNTIEIIIMSPKRSLRDILCLLRFLLLFFFLSFFLPPKVYPTHFSATTERKSMKLHRNVKHYE